MSSGSRSPTRTRSKSRPSVRPSTTSRRTSSPAEGVPELARLIEQLPPARRQHVLTHPSGAAERLSSYERLEFLGDSVLELAIARALYERYPEFEEGQLAKIRSHVVSRQSCSVVARRIGLDRQLREDGRGLAAEELERLSKNRNVLAALLEAALAALFLEHGFEQIERAIVDVFAERIDYALTSYVDYKTELQELLARDGRAVTYAVVHTEGPPHERLFTAAAAVDGEQVGTGRGRSKKEAEQHAAREALGRFRGGTHGSPTDPLLPG